MLLTAAQRSVVSNLWNNDTSLSYVITVFMLVECKLKKFPILAFSWSSGKGRHSLHNETLWEVPEGFSCNGYGNGDTWCAPSGVLNGEVSLYTSSGFSLRWMATPIPNFVALHTEKVNAAHWKGYLSGQSRKYWSNHICKLAVAKIFLDGLACMKSKHVKTYIYVHYQR